MSARPEVSVVMGVHNGADLLDRTLSSILGQRGVRLEMIVVDDGSTDGTGEILDRAAANEPRLVVVHQENRGLTRSLIRGCEMARADLIARQDAGGDVSLAGRLAAQRDFLRQNQEAVLVSCGARFVGPRGELLYEVLPRSRDLTDELTRLDPRGVRGPAHHGATMFRRRDYRRAGGYRAAFAVAQDLDLWLRLVERGRHGALLECLYEARVTPDSISSRRRRDQIRLTRIAVACARRRKGGKDEADLLVAAARVGRPAPGRAGPWARSRALYFIGRCRHRYSPREAAAYYRRAISTFPLNWRPWALLLATRLGLGPASRTGGAE